MNSLDENQHDGAGIAKAMGMSFKQPSSAVLKHNEQEIQRLATAEARRGWGVYPRHQTTKMSELDVSGEWYQRFNLILSMLGKRGRIVALLGDRGNGKTQLAVELMKEMTRNPKYKIGEGIHCSAQYITAMNFFMRIKECYAEDASKGERMAIAEFTRPRLLVIDEFGKRPEKDWHQNLLFELIDQRYGNMLDTILIDNRKSKEFVEAVGQSIASRMNEGGGIIEATWASFRK